MKKVVRYQCQFCKKEFKTPNKHNCKFNPELKNCFTCKYLKDWIYGEYVDDYYRMPNYPDCEKECGDWDIESIKDCNYNMKCEKWAKKEKIDK